MLLWWFLGAVVWTVIFSLTARLLGNKLLSGAASCLAWGCATVAVVLALLWVGVKVF